MLADPEKHWKSDFSAKLAAESWESNSGIPEEIYFAINKNDELKDSELLIAIPEFKVPLPGGSRPSQNDILAIITNSKGLSVITVEAKAKENFDKTIEEWNKEETVGKKERLNYIKQKIIFNNPNYLNLRYQLFHRLASAVIMAEKFHAKNAIMIIQSFIESDIENHYEDFVNFVNAYNKECHKEIPILLGEQKGIRIYVLWVNSKI